MTRHAGLALALLLAACGGGGHDDWPVAADPQRDIEATDLRVDIAGRTGSAQVRFGASATPGASLEVGDLRIDAVSVDGRPIDFQRSGDRLDLAVGPAVTTVRIDYAWQIHPDAGGVAMGSTLTWPQACGNLFPCHSLSADGSRFTLALSGVPAGQVAVYAASIPDAAPAYQLAWSIGPYQRTALGRTAAGTEIVRWNHADEEDAAAQGTAYLVAGFDWLERNVGPYRFGREAGPVSAHWAGDGWAGMETHPLWHVSAGSLADERVQLHEAAHGWFGDGVRLACWEDLVLSEGAATYYEARLLEEVAGAARGQAVWHLLDAELAGLRAAGGRIVARPAGCNQAAPEAVFSRALYVKGAHYLRALERRLTRPAFDASLRALYTRFGGQAAGIADLVAVVAEQTGYDATACTRDWLQSIAVPADSICP
ncbi:MAG: M1 family aminopeptidase [Rubrivivax sp.]